MSEWRVFLRLLKFPKGDVAVLLTTFLLTVLIDLIVAIGVGVVMAAFLFVRKMEEVTRVDLVDTEEMLDQAAFPKGTQVFQVYGPLFFSAVERFETAIRRLEPGLKVLILDLRHVPIIDGSGLEALEGAVSEARGRGGIVLLCNLQDEPRRVINRTAIVPPQCITGSLDDALKQGAALV